jgi:very-short-patch-repair endonuclease
VDGSVHHSSRAQQHDVARDLWMKAQGIRVLRVSAGQVTACPEAVVQVIASYIRPPSPRPLPEGGEAIHTCHKLQDDQEA